MDPFAHYCLAPHDCVVSFKQGMPDGYRVVWFDDHEMYFWQRASDMHLDGPYCDRFHARRGAVHDSKKPE